MSLVGFRGLAEILGTDNKRLHRLYQSRHANGFPEATGEVDASTTQVGLNVGAPLFDPQEVAMWWMTYSPSRNRGTHRPEAEEIFRVRFIDASGRTQDRHLIDPERAHALADAHREAGTLSYFAKFKVVEVMT